MKVHVDDMNDVFSGYAEFEREMDEAMDEMDRINAIIDQREKEIGEFSLPKEFDPKLAPEDEKKIEQRGRAMQDEMAIRGFAVCLDEGAPLKAFYLYLKYMALITEGLKMPGTWFSNYSGCKYWCEDCFQKEWCNLKEGFEGK